MSAETLRRAAALMRERAEAARDATGASDWFVSLRGLTHAADYSVRSSGGAVAGDMAEEEAEHIASWHPAVALAVADWLDFIADARTQIDSIAARRSLNGAGWLTSDPATGVFRDMEQRALAVARAYLGESA